MPPTRSLDPKIVAHYEDNHHRGTAHSGGLGLMSQPTQCATLRSGEGMLRLPFEPLALPRARPPLPQVHRLVADHRRRAVVVVSVRRIVVADAVGELGGGVTSLPSSVVVANRRTVMSGPLAARGRSHRPRGLIRRNTW